MKGLFARAEVHLLQQGVTDGAAGLLGWRRQCTVSGLGGGGAG
jgi:hypothetical protein